MDYNKSFNTRIQSYVYAQSKYDGVMNEEFKIAIEMCDLHENDIFVNIPADCGNIKKYVPDNVKYLPFEINKLFAKYANFELCQLNKIPLLDNSVNKILCLASLHHATEEERKEFYNECKRILKPNGRLIIGDVIKDSQQDKLLNCFVDKNTIAGHKGVFFTEEYKNLLEEYGFNVDIKIKEYFWYFNTYTDMINYSRNLFGLTCDDKTIIDYFTNNMEIIENNGIKLKWKLIYFILLP